MCHWNVCNIINNGSTAHGWNIVKPSIFPIHSNSPTTFPEHPAVTLVVPRLFKKRCGTWLSLGRSKKLLGRSRSKLLGYTNGIWEIWGYPKYILKKMRMFQKLNHVINWMLSKLSVCSKVDNPNKKSLTLEHPLIGPLLTMFLCRWFVLIKGRYFFRWAQVIKIICSTGSTIPFSPYSGMPHVRVSVDIEYHYNNLGGKWRSTMRFLGWFP